MLNKVIQLHKDVVRILGSGEELIAECETATCYTIASLCETNPKIKKVKGIFDNKGHFWCELDGEIIDLTVEQFGYDFEFPISKERKDLYHPIEISPVTNELLQDCRHISLISGFL